MPVPAHLVPAPNASEARTTPPPTTCPAAPPAHVPRALSAAPMDDRGGTRVTRPWHGRPSAPRPCPSARPTRPIATSTGLESARQVVGQAGRDVHHAGPHAHAAQEDLQRRRHQPLDPARGREGARARPQPQGQLRPGLWCHERQSHLPQQQQAPGTADRSRRRWLLVHRPREHVPRH